MPLYTFCICKRLFFRNVISHVLRATVPRHACLSKKMNETTFIAESSIMGLGKCVDPIVAREQAANINIWRFLNENRRVGEPYLNIEIADAIYRIVWKVVRKGIIESN